MQGLLTTHVNFSVSTKARLFTEWIVNVFYTQSLVVIYKATFLSPTLFLTDLKSPLAENEAFFTQSLRGKPLIVYNNYSFCKHSVRNNVVRWVCSTHSYRYCKAVVKTQGLHIIAVKGFHNHDASSLLINRGRPVKVLKSDVGPLTPTAWKLEPSP